MNLIGKPAPLFTVPAVINGGEIVENFSLEQFIGEKYIILFFYPADFTFVCPTEILEFQKYLPEFEKKGAVVLGCSVDSQFSHWKWLNTPKNDGGIEGVKYPLLSDQKYTISGNYGVMAGQFGYSEEGEFIFQGSPVSYRATFIIDKEGIVRHETINDLGLGRNVKETLRTLDALIHLEKFGEVCPAGWEEGQEAMKPTFEGVADYLTKHK